MRLLVAEDDIFFQKFLAGILSPYYELVFAQDGSEAWTILQDVDGPKLAILDWVMPGLSGPQVCRKVRERPSLATAVYVILLTAKNDESDIISGLQAGADDYVPKPPLPAALRARIQLGERILKLQEALTTTVKRPSSERKSRQRSSAVSPNRPEPALLAKDKIETQPKDEKVRLKESTPQPSRPTGTSENVDHHS